MIYGGGGFIGSHLADELLNQNFNVTVFDKINFDRRNIAHIENKLNVIEGDFNNEIDIKNSLKNIDIVFHLVSSTLPASSNQNPVYDVESNLIPSLKLFSESVKNKIKKIVFVSSGGTVYGIPVEIPVKENHICNPICSYGVVKKCIEDFLFMYHKLYGLDYTIFRFSNPFGERQNPFVTQGAIAVFLKKIILNETIEIWGDGSVIRDYIYIKDAVNVMVKSLSVTSENKLFNLSLNKGYTLNEILKYIEHITSIKPKIKYTQPRNIDVPVNILDNTLIKKTFGWKPVTDIEEGISKTFNYLKNFLKE
jgi:UDP-glucose 4-epimerase